MIIRKDQLEGNFFIFCCFISWLFLQLVSEPLTNPWIDNCLFHEFKQTSIHGFVSGSDTNWRNNQELKQRNIKIFLLIDPYEWSWIVFRILPLNENPFFHEQLVISALNHEQDHEQITTTLITSVNSITPLASPHEQMPPKEC